MADSLVIKNSREEKFWVSYIKGRIAKKKNFLGVITGPPGIGKSWAGLTICYLVDPNFKPNHIVTRTKQLLELINSGELKYGDAILWDEAGVDVSNRNWQSIVNKTLNLLFQTFRHKRLIVLMTVPFVDFVDAGTRKLFHCEFEVQKIDFETQKAKLKPMIIQYNSRTRKFYYKYLRVRTEKGVSRIKAWYVEKPVDWLIDAYEEIKSQFTSSLNKDLLDDLEREESKRKRVDSRKELTEKQLEALKLAAEYGSVPLAAVKSGLNERTLWFHIAQAKKKGYSVEEISERMELEKNAARKHNR